MAAVTSKDLPDLRDGLKNSSPDVRVAFIDAIGTLKKDGREAAQDLAPLVGSDDKRESEHAILALEEMGKLEQIAREENSPKILVPAIDALKAKSVNTAEALDAYENHLDHKDARVKDLAASALLDLGQDRLKLDRLSELMRRSDKKISSAAGTLLRQNLEKVTVKDLPDLQRGLTDSSREVRLAFIDAIGKLKQEGKDAAQNLADLLDSRDEEVSIRAIGVLEGMGRAGAKAVPTLESALDSGEKTVAVVAAQALCKIDPTSPPLKTKGINLLIADLNVNPDVTDLDRSLSSKSAKALLDIGAPSIDPIVRKFLTKKPNPKESIQVQVEPTAARYLAYKLLADFAVQAKNNKSLVKALKKHQGDLKAWDIEEGILVKRQAFNAFPPEHRVVFSATAKACARVYTAVVNLQGP